MDDHAILAAPLSATTNYGITELLKNLHGSRDRVLMRHGNDQYSAGQLLYKIHILAIALRSHDIKPGDAVGVYMERGPELLAALLALWLIGAVYVPLAPQLPKERIRTLIETAGLKLLLTQQQLQPQATALPLCSVTVLPPGPASLGCPSPRDLSELARPPQSTDAAYIMFTSGSSGQPKGVVLSHSNVRGFLAAVATLWSPNPVWRYLACASPGFDISLFELLAPVAFGGELVIADTDTVRDPAALLALVAREQVNVVQATPSLWQLLAQHPWPLAARPQLAISIGEALGKTLAQQLLDRCESLWNLYGPTECTIWATAHEVTAADTNEDAPTIVSLGKPLPCYSAELIDGELVLGGVGVALGYLQISAGTNSRFYSEGGRRYYRSGDAGRRDADDNLHYLGRLDNQVKINGHRIELEEIEEHLNRHDSILQAICIARPLLHSPQATQLLAFIVCKPLAPNKDASRLNGWLASWLPSWMLPHRYLLVDALPLTPSGKVDRKALLALAEADDSDSIAALDEVARELATIFCDVLEISHIGPNDSFFDLGGSSMLCATLVLTINQRFTSNLSLRSVLATPPTVLSLAALVRQHTLAPASGYAVEPH